MTTERVKSADGTAIAFESVGQGPPLILIGGAFSDRRFRTAGTPLAAALAPRFTVFSYDRRGRGDSQDTPPWAIDREVEDLKALIDVAGGSTFVYGLSAGGVLALEAALRGLPIQKLALCEPALVVDPDRAAALAELALQLSATTAVGRRSDAAALFLTRVMQMPPPAVDQMRTAPLWLGLEALAHTLSHDVRITTRGPALMRDASSLRPPLLAIHGATCPPWMRDAIIALSSAVPDGRHRTVEGPMFEVDLESLAGMLEEFFIG
jgi:pimeloyl-ACP methyl ester carboxylesterase